MIKKIQKYLLLHYPLLWNIRIVPMLLILAAIHIIFFSIGYISTSIDFNDTYYFYSPMNDLGLLYFTCFMVGLLTLIGWLVFYNRNNAFKTFYPRTNTQLFSEWVLIVVITAGICLVPVTLTNGAVAKWKSVASLEDAKKAIDVLNKVQILIPSDLSDYDYSERYNEPIAIPAGKVIRADTVNLNLYYTTYTQDQGIIIEGYIGPSLLFYKDYDYKSYYNRTDRKYLDKEAIDRVKGYEQMKSWLQNNKKDSVYAVMKDFESLLRKHNFKVSLTAEEWLQRVYNPPFFSVDLSTMIRNYEPSDSSYDYNYPEGVIVAPSDDDYYGDSSLPYLQHTELKNCYNMILKYNEYHKDEDSRILNLFCCSLAIGLALFVFSFRVTAGKHWLIAFISTGVLIFITVLLALALNESFTRRDEEITVMFVCLSWVALFFALLIRILVKCKNKSGKGKSVIYINLLIWLIAWQIPLLLLTVVAHSEYSDNRYFKPEIEDVEFILWANILFVLAVMWPVSVLIRKWKSLPEE